MTEVRPEDYSPEAIEEGAADLAGPKVAYIGFCGPIDSAGVTRLAGVLNAAVNQQYHRVYLCLSTVGGYVGDGIYLFNHIRGLPIPVIIHNTGTVASIGTTLFTAGDHRICSPNAVFMMHPVAVGSDGSSAERIQAGLNAAIADEQRTENILRGRTQMSDDILNRRRFTEVYITAQEALEHGLVHEVADFALPAGNEIVQV